jgi:hypothetical protein
VFENTLGASQGRSRVESSGDTRTRARRGDSSGRRTSPSLPAPGCLVIVRRCSAITASEYLELVLRTKADCSRAKTKFLLGGELLFALRLCDSGHLASFLQRSLDQVLRQGDRVRARFSVMTGTPKNHKLVKSLKIRGVSRNGDHLPNNQPSTVRILLFLSMGRQIVHDHDVARSNRGLTLRVFDREKDTLEAAVCGRPRIRKAR